MILRKPVEKVMGKDYNTEEFMNICKGLDFIKITSVSREPESEQLYPITGSALAKVKIELDLSKLEKFSNSIKLNSGGGNYQPKSSTLMRKVGK